uniref:Uncharacterized protein n=1 Tax=viral metagenome TaxID=1070528 RepID=A0A6C0AFJ9_9ZZZZ
MEIFFKSLTNREPKENEIIEDFEDLKIKLLNSKEYKNNLKNKKVISEKYILKLNENNYLNYCSNSRIILHNYFFSKITREQCTKLSNLNKFGSCGLPKNEAHEKAEIFFSNFFDTILNIEDNNIPQNQDILEDNNIPQNQDILDNNHIPHNHHRIWITSNETPYECDESIINIYIKSLDAFDNSWTHYFWCLDASKIPLTIKKLKEKNIIIIEFLNLIESFRTCKIFWNLYNQNYFTFCSDFIRMEIVNLYGGLYMDLGTEVTQNFNHYINNFDYIFYYEMFTKSVIGIPDICMMALKKNSKLLETYLNIYKEFEFLPEDIKNIYSSSEGFVYLKGSFFLLSLINSEADNKTKILYFNGENHFNIKHQNTWKNQPKFGNSFFEQYSKKNILTL